MEFAQNGVCAVIAAFRPRVEDLGNLAEVRPQVQDLVVVDNGSAEETLKLLRTASRVLNFVLIENGENLGIGAALNIGVRWAEANGSQWVALFDQDSTVTEGFIAQMLADFEYYQTPAKYPAADPRIQRPPIRGGAGLWSSRMGDPLSPSPPEACCPSTAFETCGYFKEELFIYTVDDEYSLRLRSQGYSIALSPHADSSARIRLSLLLQHFRKALVPDDQL